MPEILASYPADCVYNADENGIYFRAMPDNTYVKIDQKRALRGFKTAKDRITALVCCNLAGEKEKLLVIGRSAKPRCFKHVKTFPTSYKSSKNAWMTSVIWTEWLKQWNRRLALENKRILLLIDHCSAHTNIGEGLSHIAMKKLPPNTTSVMQPCDMGIIRSMKAHFRHHMRLRIIEMLEDGDSELKADDATKKINLLDAMHMLSDAWRKVNQSTVVNCWRKADFQTDQETDQDVDVTPVPPPPGMIDEEFESWVSMDDDSPVALELSEEEQSEVALQEIISDIKAVGAASDDGDGPNEEEDDDEEEEVPTPTNSKMRQALQVLTMGLERRGFEHAAKFGFMGGEIRDFLRKQPMDQMTIEQCLGKL